MKDSGVFDFKIGIVGPTRVGKTSLIASILKDSQRILEGTPVRIGPNGQKTERRLAQHHKELEGSLRAGEFNPGAVSGTEEPFTFQLQLDPGATEASISLNLLDYPGGWIDAARRPEEREQQWQECKRWMTESTVLIVPIESAIIMEAVSGRHKKAVPFILNTYEITEVTRAWAKDRAARPHEPALLLFCPVKCESYFADNGGFRDQSDELFIAVMDHYDEVLQAVRGEAPMAKIIYSPVDTIGCVEIIDAQWNNEQTEPGKFVFTADYRVRSPGRQKIRGADAVLVSLCRHLVEAKMRLEESVAKEKIEKAVEALLYAQQDEGFLGNFWLWLSGERDEREEDARSRTSEAITQRSIVERLDQAIANLAARDFGPRVREI